MAGAPSANRATVRARCTSPTERLTSGAASTTPGATTASAVDGAESAALGQWTRTCPAPLAHTESPVDGAVRTIRVRGSPGATNGTAAAWTGSDAGARTSTARNAV